MDSQMRRNDFFRNNLLLAVGVLAFVTAGFLNQNHPMPRLKLSKQDTALNINKDLLIFLSAGNRRFLTDLLWVQTLIESDLDHYEGEDLNSWMYLRFKTIAVLDPLFYQNYLWGGQYLSIVKDDLRGAVSLMEEGIRHYPDDYRLNYNLGFTYYFELGDYQRGIQYMDKIKNHPKAPPFIASTVLKMKVELGFDPNTVLSLIYDLMTSTKDEALRDKLSADFYALKAERDLKCLNGGQAGCEALDANGKPYVLIYGKFHSQSAFVPYRLKRKGDSKKSESVTTVD